MMAEGRLAARDQLVEIGAAVSRRVVGCLEVGGVLGLGAGGRESAQSVEMGLQLPLNCGLGFFCDR